MRSWLLRTLIAAGFVLTLGFAPVRAQTGQIFGEIVGRVDDDAGGVLPGVTVSLSGPAIMGVRSAVTNPDGQYRFPGINPGSYQVKFELAGFATLIRQEIIVAARTTVTIDIAMKIAGVQETITVTGASPTVDVENQKVAARFDAALLEAVPTGKQIYSTATLAPAVVNSRQDPGGINATSKNFMVGARGQHVRDELFRRHGGHAAELRPDVLRRHERDRRAVDRYRGDGRRHRRRRRRQHQRRPEIGEQPVPGAGRLRLHPEIDDQQQRHARADQPRPEPDRADDAAGRAHQRRRADQGGQAVVFRVGSELHHLRGGVAIPVSRASAAFATSPAG